MGDVIYGQSQGLIWAYDLENNIFWKIEYFLHNKISHFDTMWMYSITIYSYYVIWAKADNPQNEIQNFSALTFLFSRSIMCWEFKTYVTHVLLHNYSNLLKALFICVSTMYVTVGKNVKKIRESTQHSTIFVWYIIHEKKYWHYAEQCKKGFGNFHISFFVSGFFMI